MEEEDTVPLIIGQPFLVIGRAVINVKKGELIIRLCVGPQIHLGQIENQIVQHTTPPPQERRMCSEISRGGYGTHNIQKEIAGLWKQPNRTSHDLTRGL
ncbi:hypothetical protein CR513_12592, partial [Mucuna pruriens]